MTDQYINENDPFMVIWLQRLVGFHLIEPSRIDRRDIRQLQPEEVRPYRRCHFFGGMGGWIRALQLAGWPEGREVWTGSCPCQPFSVAGKGKGIHDERHLWPEFRRLIAECRPATLFGEQVAGQPGREWLSGVRTDMEALGYAVGSADLCAAGAGAPHIRQRLYWVAHLQVAGSGPERTFDAQSRWRQCQSGRAGFRSAVRVAHANVHGCRSEGSGHSPSERSESECGRSSIRVAGFWSDYQTIACRDGKVRRVEPGIFPLADGVPERVGRLRGYGNAIVPPLAALFVRSYMEAVGMVSFG